MVQGKNSGFSRRGVLRSLVGTPLILPAILSELLADVPPVESVNASSLAPKAPHFPARAKRVIFLHMSGGVSHIDTFDPKPKLIADRGKTVQKDQFLTQPQWNFKRYGKSGIEISDLFPNIGDCVDDLCIIRSMQNDNEDHVEATLGVHTGSVTFTRPSIGSWVSYGLGTSNQNLPSFIVIAPQTPYGGSQVWGSDFLPAVHQGTRIVPGGEPIPDLKSRAPSPEIQEMELGLINFFNQRHLHEREPDVSLAARIKSFETAYSMQQQAPEAFDLSNESDSTLKLYGLERGSTTGFAWQCLVARRLAERGVRFIELIDSGASKNWDAHTDMQSCVPLAKNIDRPIAGLLKDLKSRGMLDETLVVWTTEFGRKPFADSAGAKGRGHHSRAYSSWLAGASVKGGMIYGQTDEYGIEIASDPMHIHDFHATILYLLGIEHTRLTFRYGGRDFRLTDVSGRAIKEILA
jgi:hypothetical protein